MGAVVNAFFSLLKASSVSELHARFFAFVLNNVVRDEAMLLNSLMKRQ